MISVSEALEQLFALVKPLDSEPVTLTEASGRVLSAPATAWRDQPPFSASAMDGYALRDEEVMPGAQFDVIGEAAAGHRFTGHVASGQAVRIFTGAPVPTGADRVVIQEDVTRDGNRITLGERIDPSRYIRPAGTDFAKGFSLHDQYLGPTQIALLAAMNQPTVQVTRKPKIAILATGDELLSPGGEPNDDQIIASNSYGLHALLVAHGADPRLLPIAKDTISSLEQAFEMAAGADLLVTIGGASVGDHDLVAKVADGLGMERSFYKVAMRPGKPLMAGRLRGLPMIGLPGNPVSAMVCGWVFLLPVVRKMLGLGAEAMPRAMAPLTHDMPAGGPREHYMRACLGPDGITVHERQDSALLSVLSESNVLAIRPPQAEAVTAGTLVPYINLS